MQTPTPVAVHVRPGQHGALGVQTVAESAPSASQELDRLTLLGSLAGPRLDVLGRVGRLRRQSEAHRGEGKKEELHLKQKYGSDSHWECSGSFKECERVQVLGATDFRAFHAVHAGLFILVPGSPGTNLEQGEEL